MVAVSIGDISGDPPRAPLRGAVCPFPFPYSSGAAVIAISSPGAGGLPAIYRGTIYFPRSFHVPHIMLHCPRGRASLPGTFTAALITMICTPRKKCNRIPRRALIAFKARGAGLFALAYILPRAHCRRAAGC